MKRIDIEQQLKLSLEQRKKHILKYSIFCLLNAESIHKLALLMEEIQVGPKEIIVHEGDCYDGFYLIVSGHASVSRSLKRIQKTSPRHIITLGPGKAIGLGESGFPSQHGLRTATVTAQSPMVLLRMDLLNFYLFLKQHQDLYPFLKNMSEKFLLLGFMRQAQQVNGLPVSQLKKFSESLKKSHTAHQGAPLPGNIIPMPVKDSLPSTPVSQRIDLSFIEQMIFKKNNGKKELNSEELYLIMVRLKSLGFVDFDFIVNTANPASLWDTLFRKIIYFWKGKSIGEQN